MKAALLPIAVIFVVGSIIVPLPSALIDVLLVANLTFAAGLLLSALYVADPIKLTSLPSLLLLATLYRLALNISTTRLIIGQGDAGKTIEAFGSLVIQGSIIVGLVMFLVISLVQFIVIAKGGERVAEVAARFTLDALPGKQMSIDADVRAGLISFEEASLKRENLQIESRYYGALDGAMKFIKGDAIVGLAIAFINIIGGVFVGMVIEGLELPLAIQRYTILTVGDGLLSQLPALLNSLAAGIVVTRVVSQEELSLGEEILQQLCSSRPVRILLASVSLILAVVPGLPFLPFFMMAMMLGVFAAFQNDGRSDSAPSMPLKFTPIRQPVVEVRFPKEAHFEPAVARALLEAFEEARENVFQVVGIILPDIYASFEGEGDGAIDLLFRGSKVRTLSTAAVSEGDISEFKSALEESLLNHARELLDDAQTRTLIEFFEAINADLVSSAVPAVISVTDLTQVLKMLLRDGFTVKSFDLILQGVISYSGTGEVNIIRVYESVRRSLSREITDKFRDNKGLLQAHLISSELESGLLDAFNSGAYLQSFDFQKLCSRDYKGPIIVSDTLRGVLQDALRYQGKKVSVLSYGEILEDCRLEIISTVESKDREEERGEADEVIPNAA